MNTQNKLWLDGLVAGLNEIADKKELSEETAQRSIIRVGRVPDFAFLKEQGPFLQLYHRAVGGHEQVPEWYAAKAMRDLLKKEGLKIETEELKFLDDVSIFDKNGLLLAHAMAGGEDEALFHAVLGAIREEFLAAGGAAGAWTFTNGGRTKLLDGTFDIDTDTWKVALFTSASNIGAATTTYAGVTSEVANANGYTTGGIAQVLTLAGTTTVTVDVQTDPVWTAAGGSITARFAAIYEVAGNVLVYCLCDSTPADVTATDTNTFTIQNNASGVFTLA